MNYNSVTIPGHDYSRPLRDLLPEMIGKRSKSAIQIASKAGRRPQSVRNVLERLHAKGSIHIKRWARGNSGPYVAHYLWGAGKDAKRPEPMSNSERSARYRQTEKGKSTYAACRKRFLKSDNGSDYATRYSRGSRARKKFEQGGLAAIDPLLAAVMGRRTTEEQTCT